VKPRAFFGLTRLNQISAEQIREYQEKRAVQGCGPAILNMETGVLRRLLQRGKLWDSIADQVAIPRPPPTIGRALTRVERTALLEAAALKPEWETAFFAAQIALNTTMCGGEIKGLRWADIDLLNDTLTIRKGKTRARERVIPLNVDAFEVLVQLRKRAETFGEVSPEHYVFARFRRVGRFHGRKIVEQRLMAFDPTTPIGSWKKAWGKLVAKAGLSGLRFHDLRHDAVTRLLTNPKVSIQTAKAIAGHISQRMQDRYAHIYLEDRRAAVLDGLSEGRQTADLAVARLPGMPNQIVETTTTNE
jgi:integrase